MVANNRLHFVDKSKLLNFIQNQGVKNNIVIKIKPPMRKKIKNTIEDFVDQKNN
jgi:hypothetical protein